MNLLIRADASATIGTGHVMRCLALAQAWQDAGGHAVLAMATDAPELESRLEAEGVRVTHLEVVREGKEDALATSELAKEIGARWVAVDGYSFADDFQRGVKGEGLRLLAMDDFGHSLHYCADMVLNPDLCAEESLYESREEYTKLLLGPKFTLLRREFVAYAAAKRQHPEVARRVMVTMGGSDPDNVTLKAIRALQLADVPGIEAVVLVGGCNPHAEELESAVNESRASIRLERNVKDMPGLMAWADIAVSAGGTTCAELAMMGVPSLIVTIADNQVENTRRLVEAGAVESLGWHEELSAESLRRSIGTFCHNEERRAALSQSARNLVDGRGAARVVEAMIRR